MVDDRKDETTVNHRGEAVFRDGESIQSVKNIIQLFIKTLAQVKLYSYDHTNTKHFVDELSSKFDVFLDKHGRLDLDIGEFSLLYQQEIVYEDRQINKSLPFLFHRDGMKNLSFHRGLQKEELRDLFEIINEVSQLPPEEGDIVVLLWERDFANIDYFAPDEFLETKIGAGMESPVEYKLSKSFLGSGHLELSLEDRDTLNESRAALTSLEGFKPEPGKQISAEKRPEYPLQLPALSSEELETLEDMIEKERSMSAQEEFLSLVIEMSYLEERTEEFVSIMEILVQNHRETVQQGKFLRGADLLGHIIDLKEELSSQSRQRGERIEKFLKEIRSFSTLELIEKTFDEGQVDNLDAFFKYIYLFGSSSLKLVGDLYEKAEDPAFRQKAHSYLRYFIGEDLNSVMRALGDHRPEFSKAILFLLTEVEGDMVVDHLAMFVDYKSPILKKKAIQTLAAFDSARAGKIIARFLEDGDSGVRTEAAMSLQPIPDESLLSSLMAQAKSKTFQRKELSEKSAFLGLLARFQSQEIYKFLKSLLVKAHFLSSASTVKTSLSVLSALKGSMALESLDILKAGLKSTQYKVRKETRKALAEVEARQERTDS